MAQAPFEPEEEMIFSTEEFRRTVTAINEAIGDPPSENIEFATQMAALTEAISQRIAFSLRESGNPFPGPHLLSAAEIVGNSVIQRVSELLSDPATVQ